MKKQPSIAEFAQYRFVRDGEGNVIPLPAQGTDERILLVLDCEHWGFARLHIFEEAAVRRDKLDSFQDEMKEIAAIRGETVSRLVSWGRDGEELFYADEMLDGEALPHYLERCGKLPFSLAADWIGRIAEMLESLERPPPSFERYSTLNFQVVARHDGVVRPVFSEFHGWTKPGAQVREHRPEWYLAQLFCSLMSGVPVRTFHPDFLPRNFDELEAPVGAAVLDVLHESGDNHDRFRKVLSDLAGSVGEADRAPLPSMLMRDWLRRDLAASYDGLPDYDLSETCAENGERYAVPTKLRGADAWIQVLPGPDTIPRDGWLRQHHDATRRPGRGMMNQLHVNYIEDRGSVTLIGEERVEGVDLRSLIEHAGPVSPSVAGLLAGRVSEALKNLEAHVGACAVWWLPPENVFLVTGTRSVRGSALLIERKGETCWADFPLKFRLHQTSATLTDGVRLPAGIRAMASLAGKQDESARRSAVALPLLWFLLTGHCFRWSRPVAADTGVKDPVREVFERFRNELSEAPGAVEEDLFLLFQEALRSPRENQAEPLLTPAPKEDPIEQVLHDTLYEGPIDLDTPEDATVPIAETEIPTGAEPEEMAAVSGSSRQVEVVEEEKKEERETGKGAEGGKGWRTWSILWILVGGVVAALAVGYSLSGWSERKGVYAAPETGLAFPETDYTSHAPEFEDTALDRLQQYLVDKSGTEAVKWIPLLKQLDVAENREELRGVLSVEAEAGDAIAALLLGYLSGMESGSSGGESLTWYREAAKLGNADAQFLFAEKVFLSGGVDDDLESEAHDYLTRAARVGHVEARELLAVVSLRMDDAAGACEWMTAAALAGNTSAVYQLGLLLANGSGCPRDPAAAAAYFLEAAEEGDPRAMYALGRCYELGFGVSADFTEARRWIKAAAGLGHEEAAGSALNRVNSE